MNTNPDQTNLVSESEQLLHHKPSTIQEADTQQEQDTEDMIRCNELAYLDCSKQKLNQKSRPLLDSSIQLTNAKHDSKEQSRNTSKMGMMDDYQDSSNKNDFKRIWLKNKTAASSSYKSK